jgi:cysteine desulfurase
MNEIYFDNAATSPVHPDVIRAMLPFFAGAMGNPSSLHSAGQQAKRALEEARLTVAGAIAADPKEITFTSGGTESNNLAIQGALRASRRGRHLIVSAIEHHSVLNVALALRRQGYDVTLLAVDRYGVVELDALRDSLRDDTALVSVMLANNEVGTLEPLAQVAAIAHARGVLVHTDAVQAVGKMPVNVKELGVDLLSLTAHKFYGPKGAGALYVRRGTPIEPLHYGGHQERALRPGTENIAGIVGLAAAVRLAMRDLPEETARIGRLRDRLEAGVRAGIPDVTFNGHPQHRVPHISNISFAGVEGEALLLALDLQGIAVSTGSACTAGSTDPSHVLAAMGVAPDLAQGSLRLSLGRQNTEQEVDRVVQALADAVSRLRKATLASARPAYHEMVGG